MTWDLGPWVIIAALAFVALTFGIMWLLTADAPVSDEDRDDDIDLADLFDFDRGGRR